MILKFSEVLEIKNGKNQKKVEKIGGKYPIYGSGGIIGWADSYLCEGNNIIIGRKGNINKPIFVDKPFWNVDTAFGLISKEDILNSKYLYYFCLNYNFEKLNTTVTIPSLTKNNLLNIKINVPDLKKQEKIVKILDNIKEILLKKQNQISSLNFLSKCLFFEMFGSPMDNFNNWKEEKCINITSKIGSGSTPKGGNKNYKTEGTSFIRSMNVHNIKFNYKELVFIDEKQSKSLDNVKVEVEDVLLNITGASVARCCVVPQNVLPARVNQHVSIIRCKKDIVNPVFLCYHFTCKEYQDLLWSIAQSNGATREAITKQQEENLKVIIPPIELQNKFAERIKLIEKSKFILSETLKLQAECTFLKQI
ncbi:restriction endonuclease subunit S [Fusobacterium sp.]|uniref:restriction endonuclease subunit S n=1 Tax=Fusobacterium sp. TaxID=68766 RepID=UPI002902EF90|nr:restriction endonuclease subunit S [Fusobacterium sp.]MDU1909651.1 restriction endonuclease subunit S [Fusobacterium sp.]